MSKSPVFILGGYQTDFAMHYGRAERGIAELFKDTVGGAMEATGIEPGEIEAAHIGNFAAELLCYQGHLGAFFLEVDPAFSGLPTARHEAACASGSIAALSAMADIEAGRYGLVCVAGVELERHVPSKEAAAHLGTAAWYARECEGMAYPWPRMFSMLADEYDKRYGIRREHLAEIAKINFANAKRNPNAQTRSWQLTDAHFEENDELNPAIEGRIRRQDCSQMTDGGAAVFLASAEVAADYAKRRGISLDALPRITGWGHRTAFITFEDKIRESEGNPYVFPKVRQCITDALGRAGLTDGTALDCIEVHDCFTPTEYMAIDHFGLTPPGESWRAIESGAIAFGGDTPINPSGGLIGLGHPVGASGVRMLLDAAKQVTGTAGDYQVSGAKTAGTLNIGGSGTTSVSFVVQAG
ncbi:MAG: hypothetical protein RLZZ303_2367 [Candidatus Hydrogenedentota bacterium]|jgi:acetyl-CoA C-acetyltransferase